MIIVLRHRKFDQYTRNFLKEHADPIVVQIGCGLDARFERVDNGHVEWYDLDLPDVIDIRHTLLNNECQRYHTLAYSAFDPGWFNEIDTSSTKSHLFIAEGVFMYFKEPHIQSFVLSLLHQFPGSELIFDAFSPFSVWVNNRKFSRTQLRARFYWGVKGGEDVEKWDRNIHLIDEWFPFHSQEPRLAHMKWVRYIPFLSKMLAVYYYRLGELTKDEMERS